MTRHAVVVSLLFTFAGCTTTPLVGTIPAERSRPPATEPRAPAAQAPSAPSRAVERERPVGALEAPPPAEREPRDSAPSPMPAASLALLEQGRSQRAAGRYAAAESSIERALRIDPNNAELWLELGEIKLADGDPLQARQMAQKAMTLAGANPTVMGLAERLSARAASCAGPGC